MLSFKKSKLLFLFLLFVELAIGQQYPSRNYSTLDGLPNNSVCSILKDSRGILWVGTANGVATMQNNQIHNLYTTDGLAHNSCWAIVEDKNNNLWFGSYGGGLTFYNGKKFSVINVENGLINNKIRKLFLYGNYIYVGTEFGISVIDINTKKIVLSTKIKGSRGLFQVMGFFEDNSNVYFGTFNDGFWKVDLNAKKIILVNHNKPDIFSLHQSKDSLFFCFGDINNKSINKTITKDYFKSNISNTYFGNTIYWDFATDKRFTTYVAGNGISFSTGGIYKIEKDKIINVSAQFGVDSHEVWCLNYDAKNDVLYVGTTDKGFYEIDLKKQLNYYNASSFKKDKLEIVSTDSRNGKRIILCKDGLLLLNHLKIDKEISKKEFFDFAQTRFKKNKNILKNEYYYVFSQLKIDAFEFRELKIIDNIFWVNTNIGLFKVSINGIVSEYYPFDISSFDFINTNKLIFQQAYSHVIIVDKLNEKQTIIPFELPNKNNPKDVNTILKLVNKKYFVSKSSGLFSYQNNAFTSYYSNGIWNEKELIKAKVNYRNQLVIANSFGDVFLIEDIKKFKIIEKIDRNQLIGHSISFLECYKDYLLIGTEKGLNIYKDGKIRLVDEEQGLVNKVFTSAHINGSILSIGTTNGFYDFDIEKYLSSKTSSPKVKITGIEANYKSIGKNYFKWFNYKSNTIKFPYYENTLSISFEPQQCQYPKKLEYRYKLLGIRNANWNKWSKAKNINLTFLPDGNYNLILETKDLYSGKIASQNVLKIIVTPPFWKTGWFVSVCFALIIIVVYTIYKKRIQFIKDREHTKGEIQKRLAETKMEALQSQMNPHFIFNAMNSIQNFIIDKNTNEALMYMGEFSKLIRKTLENSSKQLISLQDEMNYLKSYCTLENMRLKNKVAILFEVDDTIDLVDTEIPPMLIQPFIENAFIHAFDYRSLNPTLSIHISQNNSQILIEIKDNGKGITNDSLSKISASKGIKLVRERINLLQTDSTEQVKIGSVPNQGTTITLKIEIEL
jgi:hypothetical protein